jgi:predicted DNA-binding protein (UPF0251 family)
MSRPPTCRRVLGTPTARLFKPAGIPAPLLEEVVMTLDEFEALRLADHEGMYQEQGAAQMNVSRATFGRILDSAHAKVARALIGGWVLKIEGGAVYPDARRRSRCRACALEWGSDDGAAGTCPRCHRARRRKGTRGAGAPAAPGGERRDHGATTRPPPGKEKSR